MAARPKLYQPSFAHNAQVALALTPALAFAVSSGGAPAAGCSLLASLLVYLLDLLALPEAALGALWLSLGALYVALVFGGAPEGSPRPALLEAAQLLLLGQTLFLLGLWASLQARAPPVARGTLSDSLLRTSSDSSLCSTPPPPPPQSGCCWQPRP